MPLCKFIQIENKKLCKVSCVLQRLAFGCEKHKYCIPNWNPKGTQLEKWRNRQPESLIFRVCEYCPDKTLENFVDPPPA